MPMGKRACGIMCFAAMAAVFVAQAAKESLSFHGTTDKDPIAYACGEEMVFTVTLVDRNAKNAPVAPRRRGDIRPAARRQGEAGHPRLRPPRRPRNR